MPLAWFVSSEVFSARIDAGLRKVTATSPDRLIQIRRNRLLSLKENRESDYVDADAVRQEIIAARRLFERQNWPVIDITRRSVEETAAAVINLLSGGRGKVEVLG